jgi:integrase/recombinase XerD
MVSSKDNRIINLWLERQPSPHTRSCYRRDTVRLLAKLRKSLNRITLGDLQSFAQSLTSSGLAPISRARTLAAVKSLFGFCHRQRYLPVDPAAELTLPSYENRLAERGLAEEDVPADACRRNGTAGPDPAPAALRCRAAGVRSLRPSMA